MRICDQQGRCLWGEDTSKEAECLRPITQPPKGCEEKAGLVGGLGLFCLGTGGYTCTGSGAEDKELNRIFDRHGVVL
jgi:hypothetical protein